MYGFTLRHRTHRALTYRLHGLKNRLHGLKTRLHEGVRQSWAPIVEPCYETVIFECNTQHRPCLRG